jgi:hypothetical protein
MGGFNEVVKHLVESLSSLRQVWELLILSLSYCGCFSSLFTWALDANAGKAF